MPLKPDHGLLSSKITQGKFKIIRRRMRQPNASGEHATIRCVRRCFYLTLAGQSFTGEVDFDIGKDRAKWW
ncbi:hypothetical protein FDZ74_00240 [bacterium]|nr:MAG: hypothetical protein FDZ74_00240 [bacterium]